MEFIIYAIEQMNSKRQLSTSRLFDELDKLKLGKEMTSTKVSVAVQEYLERTYNYLDVNYMKDFRTAVAYHEDEGGKAIVCDLDGLGQSINKEIRHEIEHLFERVTGVTRLMNGGLESLILNKQYADNLAKNVSSNDFRQLDLDTKTLQVE